MIPTALNIDCCPVSGRYRGYGCWVVREEVPGCAALVEDFIGAVEDGVGELVGAQVLPDVFDRVEACPGLDPGSENRACPGPDPGLDPGRDPGPDPGAAG